MLLRRIVVLGPGGSGASTFARALGERTGIVHVELDTVFWWADLQPTPADRWADVQTELCAPDAWILDGDLGRWRDSRDARSSAGVAEHAPTARRLVVHWDDVAAP